VKQHCDEQNIFVKANVSYFENSRTSVAGAKLTLLEFLFSTGMATSTFFK
jgi:hypothetical protein